MLSKKEPNRQLQSSSSIGCRPSWTKSLPFLRFFGDREGAECEAAHGETAMQRRLCGQATRDPWAHYWGPRRGACHNSNMLQNTRAWHGLCKAPATFRENIHVRGSCQIEVVEMHMWVLMKMGQSLCTMFICVHMCILTFTLTACANLWFGDSLQARLGCHNPRLQSTVMRRRVIYSPLVNQLCLAPVRENYADMRIGARAQNVSGGVMHSLRITMST